MKLGYKGISELEMGFIFAPYYPFGNKENCWFEHQIIQYKKLITENGYCPILLWEIMHLDKMLNDYNKFRGR